MSWIKHNTILSGENMMLVPLEEKYVDELNPLATDDRLWEFIPIDMSDEKKRLNVFLKALIDKEKASRFPFVIIDKKNNKIVWSTRLMEIYPSHLKLEIELTWLHPNYWATGLNLECKFLFLTYCFDELKAQRVQLKTDENNLRSVKAILKIGGHCEGPLRNDVIRENGMKRNSHYFSILDSKWQIKNKNSLLPQQKQQLPKQT